MIKNIVFDFGGVIVDIDRDKAVQAFIKLGLADADTRLDKYHQTGIFQELYLLQICISRKMYLGNIQRLL